MGYYSRKKTLLPIVTDIPSAYMLQPMGVLKAHEHTKEWYYENFINICCDNWKNGRFLNIGNGFLGFYCDVFDYTILNYDDLNLKDIVRKLKAHIDKGNYAFIYLDEYYISAKNAYMNYAFRHQSLIHGYDDNDSTFNALAFDKTGHYAELKYSYDEVKKGFASGEECADPLIIEPYAVIFFKIKPNFHHELSLKNVITSLKDYINGAIPNNCRHIQSNLIKNGEIIVQSQPKEGPFGLNVVREIADLIEQSVNGDMNNRIFINRIHFLYEHSQLILERIKFYQKKYQFDDNYVKLIQDYGDLVARYQLARMLFLKMEMESRNSDTLIGIQEKYFSKISATLRSIIPEEKNILNAVAEYLKHELHSNKLDKYIQPSSKMYDCKDYKLDYKKASDTKSYVVIAFDKPTRIKSLSVANVADYIIKIDGKNYDSIYYKDAVSAREDSYIKVRQSVSEIMIEADYNFDLKLEDMRILVYSDNIFLDGKVTASSIWSEENAHTNNLYVPEKVVDGSDNSYWRAKAQKQVYDSSDWLEVDIGSLQKLNTILLGEHNDYPRIKEYSISYTNAQGKDTHLLTAEFKTGEKQIITFPVISAKKVRINFLRCIPDSYGYTEPLIKFLEGYYINNI